MKSRIICGAMSGTSADGVDIALVKVDGHSTSMSARLLQHHFVAYSGEVRRAIFVARAGGAVALSTLAALGRDVTLAYATAVNKAIAIAGLQRDDVAAIAAHGQTLFHDPPSTIQWLDAPLLAAETGIAVVSDFRRADCAAGGQGAPLVPYADFILFRHETSNRVLLNLGGIANITYLRAGAALSDVIAFDTGPGNCISDALMRALEPGGPGVDVGGEMAARGVPIYRILENALQAEYFAKPPPKSTDGPAMLSLFDAARHDAGRNIRVENLLRTACLLTATTVADAMRRFLDPFPDELIISGGGIRNGTLIELLRQPLGDVAVRTVDELGIASEAKEAVAFALLAAATLDGLPSNVPSATGARRSVILGSVTPRP